MKKIINYKKFIFIIIIPLLLIFSSNSFLLKNQNINTAFTFQQKQNELITDPLILNSFNWTSILNSVEKYSQIYKNSNELEILKSNWKNVKNNESLFLNENKIIELNKVFIDKSNFFNTNTFTDYNLSFETQNLTKENSPLNTIINFKQTEFFLDMLLNFFIETSISSNAYKFNNENAMAFSFNDASRGNPELIQFSKNFENIFKSPATFKVTDFNEPVPSDYFIYQFSDTFKANFNFITDGNKNIVSFDSKINPGTIPIFAPISFFLNDDLINTTNSLLFENVNNSLKETNSFLTLLNTAEKELESDPLNSQNFLNSGNLIMIIVLPIGILLILFLSILLFKKKIAPNSKKTKF